MIWKLAWRNILKNIRRSIVTLVLGILCCTLMIFYESFGEGSRAKMIDDSVAMYSGYLQIHGAGYQDHPNYDNLIYDLAEVESKIKDIPGIDTYGARFETFALYSTNVDSIGGMLVGVEPNKEANLSRLKRALKDGRFLNDNDTNGIYLGCELAKRLELNVGSELVLLSSAVDYSMAAGIYKVIGTFQTNFYDFDNSAGFVNKKQLDVDFLSDNIATHIIVLPKDKGQVVVLQNKINKALDQKKYETVTWKTTAKDLVQYMSIDEVFDSISFVLFLVIVFFVIMIFSLISIFQRTREIGIMRAIGTSQAQIYKTLFAEIVILALVSVLIGGVLGSWLSIYFTIHPLVLKFGPEMMELYKQWGIYDLTFPAKLTLKSFISGVIPVLIMMIMAVIYPAWKINRLKPIDAIEERS
jgi:ABC-type lipoprotein release transport system permease subunit